MSGLKSLRHHVGRQRRPAFLHGASHDAQHTKPPHTIRPTEQACSMRLVPLTTDPPVGCVSSSAEPCAVPAHGTGAHSMVATRREGDLKLSRPGCLFWTRIGRSGSKISLHPFPSPPSQPIDYQISRLPSLTLTPPFALSSPPTPFLPTSLSRQLEQPGPLPIRSRIDSSSLPLAVYRTFYPRFKH